MASFFSFLFASLSLLTRFVFARIFLRIHRCMNTCNRSRLLFLPPRSRRPSNLHILHRADCPPYCVQPTAELLHIEHKLALLHHNENTNGVHRHVRKVCVFSPLPLFEKYDYTSYPQSFNKIMITAFVSRPSRIRIELSFFKWTKNRGWGTIYGENQVSV